MSDTTYYKVTGPNGESIHGGTYTYPLPDGDTPGAWAPPIDDPVVCERGYHLTTDPMQWAEVGMRVFTAEHDGIAIQYEDKSVHRTVRLIRERPEMVPDWWRKVEAWVSSIPDTPWFQPQGDPDPAWRVFETRAAAWDAAWAAAGFAAWDFSWAAAWDAAGDAARVAAWDFSWAAAWDAAGDAARVAAGDAARVAAGDAAGDAARAAAGDAAGDAARAAAGDAAGDAARAAARDAALLARAVVCGGLLLDQQHIDHAHARWDVWKSGRGLLCDMNGVLYVYRRVS